MLRTTRRLSVEEELGLWGELWLISQTSDVSTSIQAWQGPAAAVVDFVGGGVGVECKTSLHRFRHQVSHSQLDRPVGDYEVFLLSIFVSEDPLAGKTLPDLIHSIAATTNDAPAFESKLLNVGYSRSDAALYQRHLAVVEAPRWFPIDVIPRVRTFDAGVSNIRTRSANSVVTTTIAAAIAMPHETREPSGLVEASRALA